jgi:hypothetical protein
LGIVLWSAGPLAPLAEIMASSISAPSRLRAPRTARPSGRRENITDNYVGNLIHLAWLAPKQVQLVLDGDPKATSLARTSMLARTSDPWWVDRILMPVIGGAKPLESHYSFETPAPLAKRHRTSAH